MVLSMEKWMGKVAIVTGATSGIGAAVADALVENGLIVAGLDRSENRVATINQRSIQLLGKKGKLYGVKADLTKEDDILAAFKWVHDNLGLVHIVVNCAGFFKEAALCESTTENWRRTIDTNVIALCIMSREAVKKMMLNNINGHIVYINSILGHFCPIEFRMNIYSATKCAVTALTETMRQELISSGSKIKVTSVSPGLTVSEMTIFSKDLTEETRRFVKDRPILKAEDVADAVVYALSTPEHVQVHELTIKPVGEPH
ncbi:hypothetical protein Zmor_017624 [Zophobas morio]|uniref:Dehydrogenase/reductase SDR family member 11 n=1 Tax=Zophobas morio TaxID=2755281 RepID=A0AA38I9I1_9CUCU|nr:hypothetical protein Zmor_017624 [Zophobas morio]